MPSSSFSSRATIGVDDLMAYAKQHIHERDALPKHIEVLTELPKTAIGKVFKPDLRRRAITRVYNEALAGAGLAARVSEVVEDKKRGLVARLVKTGPIEKDAVQAVLGEFTQSWEFLA